MNPVLPTQGGAASSCVVNALSFCLRKSKKYRKHALLVSVSSLGTNFRKQNVGRMYVYNLLTASEEEGVRVTMTESVDAGTVPKLLFGWYQFYATSFFSLLLCLLSSTIGSAVKVCFWR
jgi:hypothetical protein